MIDKVVLFGATGDLAGRFLLPALAHLLAAEKLPAGFQLLGGARQTFDDDGFRAMATDRLEEHASDVSRQVRAALVEKLTYRPVDLTDPTSVAALIGNSSRPIAAYLALPPATFSTAVKSLGAVGLAAGSRIVLEKPFGEDLDSAMALNQLIADVADEEMVFRVDHVLGMATVHNLIGARFANRILEPVWNSTHIEQVDILWDETLALEGRAGYYDQSGALKDVIQNHLLQILALVTMEPPSLSGDDPRGVSGGSSPLDGSNLRDRKVEALGSVRILNSDEVAGRTSRARYTAGTLAAPPEGVGSAIPAYVDEEGVDPTRNTETFVEILLELDSPRWTGTRFRLRTGKALAHRHKGVIVKFRAVPFGPFGPETTPPPNELRIGLDGPENFTLHLTGHAPGPPPRLLPLALDAPLPAGELPAYSHVLLNILSGDNTLSVRGDEAELSWRIVTPILEAWSNDLVPLQDYPAGATGPDQRLETTDSR